MRELQTDVLVVGGGLGGVAAALAAAALGCRVVISEETDWLGGQLTAQAVPPDEHPWIETTGCSASYRRLRTTMRDLYRRNPYLTETARRQPDLNPGAGFVSGLCCEPRVALAAIQELLAPHRAEERLVTLLHHRPVAVDRDGDRVAAITLAQIETGEGTIVRSHYVLDATELGDLFDLAGIEHVIGAESQDESGELHALPGPPDPMDQQAISWCFALDYFPGETHTIERPDDYPFWRSLQPDFWPGPLFGWTDVNPVTLDARRLPLFAGPADERYLFDLWHYRRIAWRSHWTAGALPSDITLVNWPQIDYFLGPLIGVSVEEKQTNLRRARAQSLAFLYWMQTEAPRHDGPGFGYPGLRLRPDVMGTVDGLAKQVYVRESRRIRALFTVLEEHVGVEQRRAAGLTRAAHFADSVGVGFYRIDLHPSTKPRSYVDVDSFPFQLPLGALIPVRVENVLPACKNIGTTHITNGCYRLHPVEWSVGEAAGALAAWCLARRVRPHQVCADPTLLHDFQTLLADVLGVVLVWPAATTG